MARRLRARAGIRVTSPTLAEPTGILAPSPLDSGGGVVVMDTAFAPAERASREEVLRQHAKLAALPFVREFLDAIPDMSMVLNGQRQIVFANRAFSEFLAAGRGDPLASAAGPEADVLGCRPGEAVGCLRFQAEGDCGTTAFCRTCGAAIAIVSSQKRHAPEVRECRMFIGGIGAAETALDLRVWARPIEVQGESFTMFSLVDISDEKRRKALEQIFFHDVLNTASGVKGLADLMVHAGMPEAKIRHVAGMVAESADKLVEEISAQQMLIAAENHELLVSAQPLRSLDLLQEMVRQFHSHSAASRKKIEIAPGTESCEFASDPVLLRRVLTNLIKNALESIRPGETVTLGSHADADSICFTVHNGGVIPAQVQLQIFNRSFSTKGSGRGLGTYSIKLISERYLGGHVSFVSNAEEGTRFTVRYPRTIRSTKPVR